jgi:SOS response regulatory protein OraA/RecX
MAKKFFEDEGEIVIDASDRKEYLSSNMEIDAYAHEFAETLLRNYGKERAISILRTANEVDDLPIPDQLQEYFDGVVDEKQFRKLVGKVYSNIIELSQRGIVESVIRRLLKLSENAK